MQLRPSLMEGIMPEHDETDAMTTNQTEREQEAEQHEDAPPPVRERWGQDPWVMRWGC